MVCGWAPAATAVLIASVSMDAAPLADAARPARNRTPASTGAAVAVAMVTARGDRPLLADIDLEDVDVVGGEDGFGVSEPRRPGGGRGFGGRGGAVVVSLSW